MGEPLGTLACVCSCACARVQGYYQETQEPSLAFPRGLFFFVFFFNLGPCHRYPHQKEPCLVKDLGTPTRCCGPGRTPATDELGTAWPRVHARMFVE